MSRIDFSPYDGPLAERLILRPLPEYSSNFTIAVDSPALKGFEHWLRRHPIHVLAPGHAYVGWSLRAYPSEPGELFVSRFNVLLSPTEQPLGPYRGDAGAMLEWAFAVLDHYHLPFDPETQHHEAPRDQLIQWYREESDPIDWQAVAHRLRATGRPVPDDLFEQPTR